MSFKKMLIHFLVALVMFSALALAVNYPFTPKANIDMQGKNITNVGEIEGNISFTSIDNWPPGCSDGYYVSALNDSVTCTDSGMVGSTWTDSQSAGNHSLNDVSSINNAYYVQDGNGSDIDAKLSANCDGSTFCTVIVPPSTSDYKVGSVVTVPRYATLIIQDGATIVPQNTTDVLFEIHEQSKFIGGYILGDDTSINFTGDYFRIDVYRDGSYTRKTEVRDVEIRAQAHEGTIFHFEFGTSGDLSRFKIRDVETLYGEYAILYNMTDCASSQSCYASSNIFSDSNFNYADYGFLHSYNIWDNARIFWNSWTNVMIHPMGSGQGTVIGYKSGEQASYINVNIWDCSNYDSGRCFEFIGTAGGNMIVTSTLNQYILDVSDSRANNIFTHSTAGGAGAYTKIHTLHTTDLTTDTLDADDISDTVISSGNGYVSYWAFEENTGTRMYDSSNEGNDCTVFEYLNIGKNNGTSGRVTDGYFGNGMSFYDHGYIECASVGISPNEGTVSLWAYPIEPKSSDIMFYHRPGANDRIYLICDNENFEISIGDQNFIDTGTACTGNIWQHFMLTWDNGDYVAYRNGQSVKTGTYTDFSTFSNTIRIGGISEYGNTYNGTLDEVKLLNITLNAAEARAEYTLGLASHSPIGHLMPKTGGTFAGNISSDTGFVLDSNIKIYLNRSYIYDNGTALILGRN